MPTPEQAESLLPTSFPSALTSVALARHLIGAFVIGRVPSAVAEDAQLLGSELATNAVVHARTEFSLAAFLTTGILYISVTDGQHNPPILNHQEKGAVGGWGMQIVDEVAARWGVDHLETGKRVWFELDLPESQ